MHDVLQDRAPKLYIHDPVFFTTSDGGLGGIFQSDASSFDEAEEDIFGLLSGLHIEARLSYLSLTWESD